MDSVVTRLEIYLNLNSEIPIYQQIRNQVILGIAEGRLQPDESLPSTRQLAADFGINFHTVNKGYDILRQEGIIRLNRKTGAVVSVDPTTSSFLEEWRETIRVSLAEAIVKGIPAEDILRECQTILQGFAGIQEFTAGDESAEGQESKV
jgi:DNA-binding transcriptional regulator YhcF (GntR family)